MGKYKLSNTGNLLITKAAIAGQNSVKVLSLLIDTGSSYTILFLWKY